MKATKIIYWITTVMVALIMTMSALMQLSQTAQMQENMHKIGYPSSLLYLLGVLKALGVVALLIPGYPKIREWAYAGFVFLLIGATYSHFSVGDYSPAPVIIMLILATSYFTRYKIDQGTKPMVKANWQ